MARRFEMIEGSSSKFWMVDVKGPLVTVTFGKIGTDGQTKDRTHPSPEAAKKDAEKLVREKLAKGYVELGAKGPAKSAAPAKPASPSRPIAGPAPAKPSGPPGKFAFSAELDGLFAKGYPYLRLLTDEAVAPKVAAREALKGLEAIDPYFQVRIPRAIAARYLRGYPLEPFTESDEIKAAVAEERPVDEALLAEVLEKKVLPSKSGSYGGETYDFRLDEVVFLFEAFLGAERVAARIVEHLVAARDNPKWWGDSLDHDHREVQRIAISMGWLRLRMPPARWKAIVMPLAGSRQPKLPEYSKRLRNLADDRGVEESAVHCYHLAMQRRDRAPLEEFLARWNFYADDPQFFYVVGADRLLGTEVKKLPREPKWQQRRIVEEFGQVRAPGAVRTIAALLESRSSGELARAWLEQHRPYVEKEALPVLAAKDPATARAVKAALSGAAQPPVASSKELKLELRGIFKGLGASLKTARGDAKKERAVLETAFARYCEINAALGEVSPDAYFTHSLADAKFDADQETTQRWIDLAVEVADANL